MLYCQHLIPPSLNYCSARVSISSSFIPFLSTKTRPVASSRMSSASKTIAASSETSLSSETDDLNLNEHSELLESFYKIPAIDKAWLLPSKKTGKNLEAMVTMSQVDLLANSKKKYMSFVQIPKLFGDEAECNWSAFPFELHGATLVVPSNSGKKLLIIKNSEPKAKDNSSSTKIEVWSSTQLLKEIIIPSTIHGAVYADGWFEGVSWSQDELYVAYVAEEPAPNRPTFGKSFNSEEKANENNPYSWKGQGDWQEDWGESYTGKRRPHLFVASLQSGIVQAVKGIPEHLSVGQVLWAPELPGKPQKLIFVGWPSVSENFKTSRKLGIKYCFNRPCALYTVEVPQAERLENHTPSIGKLTHSISSAFMPRFSPDGDFLLFLSAHQAVRTGAHNATNSLHVLQWPVGEAETSGLSIREVVSAIKPAGDLPGLYCQSLITCPWLLDKTTLLLSSPWHSSQVILAINVKSGEVSRITPSNDTGCWSVLSIWENYVLAARSTFGKPPSLKLGCYLTASGLNSSKSFDWMDICNPSLQYATKVDEILSSINYNIMNIPIQNLENKGKGSEQSFEAIFVSSKGTEEQTKYPLVVVVHGGPHSVYTTGFSRAYAFLAGLGLNLLLVNYRGSLGFGEESLQSLPGNAGHQDVADVLAALDHAISQGLVDPRKVAVLGGSHGGFLSTHLIGQAPDRFVTAAVINPVCNISSMIGVTDIPDWCYVETYGEACFSSYSDSPSAEHLKTFYQASPMYHINKVKVPTLFLLGAQDRRVPISNGFQYVQALRSRGLKVKVIVFPEDAHPIDRPQSEYECWLSIGAWMKKHLSC